MGDLLKDVRSSFSRLDDSVRKGLRRFDDSVRNTGRKLDDTVRGDFFDDVLGIEDPAMVLEAIAKGDVGGLDPTGVFRGNKERLKQHVSGLEKRAKAFLAKAERERNLPYILANQALAARRKKLASSSLLASGAQGGGSGGGMLATVLATGKNTLGA